ncbi:hypothetical protein BC941DRAFT_87463 [Chlamydoabsidia padenii]|nr:hypothetical protein BC941DRAFT_87463 [Chlamydoabsidia padenii]
MSLAKNKPMVQMVHCLGAITLHMILGQDALAANQWIERASFSLGGYNVIIVAHHNNDDHCVYRGSRMLSLDSVSLTREYDLTHTSNIHNRSPNLDMITIPRLRSINLHLVLCIMAIPSFINIH